MRNTEQRVLAVKLRTKEIENQRRIMKRRIICIGSPLVSILFLVGLAFIMPSVMGCMSENDYGNTGSAASIFDGSNFFGFVLVAFIAFVLGVSVTILSYKIKIKNQLEQEDKENKGD